MNIGADGQDRWAVGRITGEQTNIVNWTTPHGSTFESEFIGLYELNEDDKIELRQYEQDSLQRSDEDDKKNFFYGNMLNDVSHEIMKL
jgi:hypothetical protein